MKKESLALLLAAPKRGSGDDEPDDGEGYGDDGKDEDYQALAEQAFPDEDWTPERVKALKEFVMKCMG